MTDWTEMLKQENLTPEEQKWVCNKLMTSESHMEQLILKYFTAADFRAVNARRIGGGVIGGKACGLLVARKLIALKMPELAAHMEPHNSYFIGTDVFYQYMVCLLYTSDAADE